MDVLTLSGDRGVSCEQNQGWLSVNVNVMDVDFLLPCTGL